MTNIFFWLIEVSTDKKNGNLLQQCDTRIDAVSPPPLFGWYLDQPKKCWYMHFLSGRKLIAFPDNSQIKAFYAVILHKILSEKYWAILSNWKIKNCFKHPGYIFVRSCDMKFSNVSSEGR